MFAPVAWLRSCRRPFVILPRKEAKPLDAWEEEVGAASYRGEGWKPLDHLPNGSLGDLVFQRAVLGADDRIAFVAEFMKRPIIGPDVLSKLELPDKTGATHEG